MLFETHRRCELEALPVEAERSMPRAARNDARPPERGDARPRERGRDQRVSLCADFCRSELILRFTHVTIASRPGAPLSGGGWPGRWPRNERARIKTAPLLNQYDVRDINAVSFKCVGRRWRSGWPSPKRSPAYVSGFISCNISLLLRDLTERRGSAPTSVEM